MQLMKKHSKRILKKQSLRLKKAVVRNRLVDSTAADIASVQVDLTITTTINIIINTTTTITINITNMTGGNFLASHHHHHVHHCHLSFTIAPQNLFQICHFCDFQVFGRWVDVSD